MHNGGSAQIRWACSTQALIIIKNMTALYIFVTFLNTLTKYNAHQSVVSTSETDTPSIINHTVKLLSEFDHYLYRCFRVYIH